MTAANFAGLCATSEAGHRRHGARHNSCCVQQTSCPTISSGCSGQLSNGYDNYGPSYGSSSYGNASYGSNSYGNSGVYGSTSLGAGHRGNVGGRVIGNGMILTR